MEAMFPGAMPLMGLLGGLMIGLASAVMLLGLGRVAGVSGMAADAAGMGGPGAESRLALAFIVGLPLGAALVSLVVPLRIVFPQSLALLIAGGLLVGFGTRLGNGCTSGHGICGLSRLAPRSLLATALFMAAGFATVTLLRLVGAS